jgi:hypothetical protein
MSSRKHILFLLMLLALSVTCPAQTWDATRDFAAFNPNGAWSYGYGVTGTSFTLYPTYNHNCVDEYGIQGVVCWTAEEYDHVPLVGFNTTGDWLNFITVVDPPNALITHPAPDWAPADSIVQWTAPVTANYRILDTNPTGIIGLAFRNGTLLFRVELLGPGAQHPDQTGGRANFYLPQVSLNAGDVISFGVNSDGTFYYDSTGFNATIVTPANAPPCTLCSQH